MYTIVQTFEDEDFLLSILPTKWTVLHGWEGEKNSLEGQDLCFWPSNVAGYRLLERSKKNPDVAIDESKLTAHRCKIKRSGFQTYAEATRQLKIMETTPDTDGCDTPKTPATGNRAAVQFQNIQAKVTSGTIGKIPSGVSQSAQIPSVPVPEVGNHQLNVIISLLQNLNENVTTIQSTVTALGEKVSTLQSTATVLQEEVGQNRNLLARANAKIDYLASSSSNLKVSASNQTVKLKKVSLSPVQSIQELTDLEEQCKDEEFVKSIVRSIGRKMEKNLHTGNGATVCLRVIDDIFSREFLTKCSWTGVSRTHAADGSIVSKHCLQRFEKVIDLFYQIIVFSDPIFTTNESNKFLQRCVQNAKQRFEEVKGTRNSSSRKRRKRNLDVTAPKDDTEEIEDDSSIAEGEGNMSNDFEGGNGNVESGNFNVESEFEVKVERIFEPNGLIVEEYLM